jgi:hypothetical protein
MRPPSTKTSKAKLKASDSYSFSLDFDGADALSINAYRHGGFQVLHPGHRPC